jgi:outer membrane protein
MLKRILLVLAIALPMLMSAQTVKIGVVDTQTILENHPDLKTAQTKLAEFSKKYEDEFAKLRTEYTNKVEEYQKLPADEPASIKERKAKDIQDLETRIQQYSQDAQTAIQKEQSTLFQPIQQKVLDAIEAVGKENGFTIIQEKDALIYYAAPAEDITTLVRKKLGI